MRYSIAVQYLFSFLNYERIPFEYDRALNLKRMDCVLNWAHHPERQYPSILVAGTKGKGSTANFISSLFSSHGYRTGLYTSPHLIDPRERIRINSKAISKNEFAQAVTETYRVLKKHRGGMTPYGKPTFFEMFTWAAMLHFAEKNVEIAVFEVGMGGRLDATNVLHPLVSVMTPVSFDHEEHLGRTLSKIAGEKAAIIKKRGMLVLSEQPPEARKTILGFAQKARAKVFGFGSGFKVSNVKHSQRGSRFNFQMGNLKLKNLFIKLPGAFQVQNAACAIAACVLGEKLLVRHVIAAEAGTASAAFFSADERGRNAERRRASLGRAERWRGNNFSPIRLGLQNAFWPGRFEVVKRGGRTYILDGAHNGASAEALAESLKRFFQGRDILFILGVSQEKNVKAILASLAPVAFSFVMTKSVNPRAQEPKIMIEALSHMGFRKNSFWSADLKEALELARKITTAKHVIAITGSLFLIGEARKALQCRPLL